MAKLKRSLVSIYEIDKKNLSNFFQLRKNVDCKKKKLNDSFLEYFETKQMTKFVYRKPEEKLVKSKLPETTYCLNCQLESPTTEKYQSEMVLKTAD